MTNESLRGRELFKVLGEKTLKHLTGTEFSQIRNYVDGIECGLTDVQIETVDFLLMLEEVIPWRNDWEFFSSIRSTLCQRISSGQTLATSLHERCTPNSIAAPSPLMDTYRFWWSLAVDDYPISASAAAQEFGHMAGSLVMPTRDDEFKSAVRKTLQSDPMLEYLVSEYNGDKDGGVNELWQLVGGVLSCGWGIASLYEESPSIHRYAASVVAALALFRGTDMRGLQLPALVSMAGVHLPEGIERIKLGQVELFHAPASKLPWAREPRFVENLSDSIGDHDEKSWMGDVTALISTPPENDGPAGTNESDDSLDQLIRRERYVDLQLENLRLALLIATSDSEIPLVPTLRTVLDPRHCGTSSSSAFITSTFKLKWETLTVEQVEQWEYYFELVSMRRGESLDLIVRRILSAASDRTDSTDALIDAAMAWEGLFGTKSETSFRVTGAMAKLLEPKEDKRLALQKKLRGIYDKRSRVVHGDHVDPEAIELASRDAVHFAIESIRMLLEARPELLQLVGSQDRADRILLCG